MADVDLVKTRIGYGPNSKIREIVDGLKFYIGREDELKKSLVWQASEAILNKLDVNFDNLADEIKFLESLDQELAVGEIQGTSEVEPEDFEANKSLNSQDLKILLEEYDQHRDLKDLEKIAEEAKKNPALARTHVRDLVRELQKKVALEAKEEKLTGNKIAADNTSDQILITQSRLEEQGVEPGKAVILAEEIVEKAKNKEALSKEDVINLAQIVKKEETARILEVARVVVNEQRVKETTRQAAENLIERVKPVDAVVAQTTQAVINNEVWKLTVEGKVDNREEIVAAAREIAKELKVETEIVQIALTETVKNLEGNLENDKGWEEVKAQNRFDGMWKDVVAANPQMTPQQEATMREFVEEVSKLEPSGIREHQEEAVNQIVGTQDATGQIITKSRAEAMFGELDTAVQVARSGEEKINRLVKLRARIRTLDTKIPFVNDTLRKVDGVLSIAEKDPGFAKLMASVGNKITAFNSFYNGIGYKAFAKVGGEKAVTWLATKIGGEAGKTIANEGLKIMASQGLKTGLTNIFTQLAGNVGLKVSSAVATKLAGNVVTKTIGLAAGWTNPVGWALNAVFIGFELLKGIVKNANKGIEKAASFLGIDAPKLKAKLEDTFGKIGGNVAYYGGGFVAMLLALPTLIGAGVMTVIIGPVITAVFLGLFIYQIIFQQPQISSIKPPEGMGGGQCVLKSKVAEMGGAINCDQNAPEVNYPGLTKAKFVKLAGMWSQGKNYAEECYNDVVNRALCAGINPVYALWVWVHESGASNYEIPNAPNIEDFGVHYLNKPKDFDAQITEFLTLDPGGACFGTPKIGNNYWLGFATNFLNGSCDPDEPNETSGQTGREYLANMMGTWSWISSEPMPNGIHVTAGGQNCGSHEASETYDFIDQDGNEWVCTKDTMNGGGLAPVFGEWDPNSTVPEDCPGILPSSGVFTQGPFAQGCSHRSMSVPAIDIGAPGGTEIRATHDGVVQLNHDAIYGYFIDLHGSCGGVEFYTRYGHMPNGGYRVGNGDTVKRGDVIGIIDNTGSSTGNHLHYHITGLDKGRFGEFLGLSKSQTEQLWGCCGKWNGKYCP